jgi:FAD synthetase
MPEHRVVVFGTFDPLHEGHRQFFKQAKALGTYLLVVVARDSTIRAEKGREPYESQPTRLQRVGADPAVDEVILGEKHPQQYRLLRQLAFDVIALGYDQEPGDQQVRRLLDESGKHRATVIRVKPHQPTVHKSSLLRK